MNKKIAISLTLCLLVTPILFTSCNASKMESKEEDIPVDETDTTEPMDTGMTIDPMDTGMTTDMTTEPMGTDISDPTVDPTPSATPEDIGRFPKFPWPPPEASAVAMIPRQFLANPNGDSTRLSDINQRFMAALERSGYLEYSYYAVPRGFALVTRMEHINTDGTPKGDTERWVLERQPLKEFSLNDYVRALFKAAPGRYRIIAFIVTPNTFKQTKVVVTSDEASKWPSQGANQLPSSIGSTRLVGEDIRGTALIYEFERVSDVASPRHRKPSPLLGRTHLEKSGIWRGLTNAH